MRSALLLASLGLLACASTELAGDSGIDASVDAGMDSGLDSGLDSGVDSGIDSGMDASVVERRMFVTSSVRNANFGGLDGADALCASEASAASLDGEFKAWLSTMTSSVSDRLVHSSEPYVLVDGTRVANDWDDLVDGSILVPINMDASGQLRGGDVWTGTLPNGLPYTQGDCAGFTNGTDGIGLCGSTASTTGPWTASSTPDCSLGLALYCIEQ
jgi:hypothetical protein